MLRETPALVALTLLMGTGGCRKPPAPAPAAAAAAAAETATVEVTGDALLVRGVKLVSLTDAGFLHTREEYELVESALKASGTKHGEQLPLIRVEPTTRYVALLSVLRALRDGDFSHARLTCTKVDSGRQFYSGDPDDLPSRKRCEGRGPDCARFFFTIAAAPDGFFLGVTGEEFPGHGTTKPTIPNVDGGLDFEALRVAVAKVKASHPDEAELIFAGPAETRAETVCRTLDVVAPYFSEFIPSQF